MEGPSINLTCTLESKKRSCREHNAAHGGVAGSPHTSGRQFYAKDMSRSICQVGRANDQEHEQTRQKMVTEQQSCNLLKMRLQTKRLTCAIAQMKTKCGKLATAPKELSELWLSVLGQAFA